MRVARGARPLALALALLSVGLTAPALAAQAPGLQAALIPERPGHSTTIELGARIPARVGALPSPLTGLALLYPANLGIARSGLGLATCTPAILEGIGPEGCPADSRMGYGSATAEIEVGPELEEETAVTSIFMAPVQNGNLAVLLYANAKTPLDAQIVLGGLLLPAPAPYGGSLSITTPLIPSWPAGPYISIISLHATIGAQHLTYYEHRHGKTIPYHPQGIRLPTHCPHGGFPFAATFSFQDGSQTTTHTTVPCPAREHPGRAAGKRRLHRT